jgi:transcription antitermination factor NusG
MLMAVESFEVPEMIEGAACPWPRGPRLGRRDGVAWYLLQARSGAEAAVTDFLKPFGYEVYYPKTLVMRLVPKRELTPSQRGAGAEVRRPKLMAVFPSYPFIRFDLRNPRCHELFDFAGVYGLHCTAERPVVVDDAYIGHLRSLEQDGIIPASTAVKDIFAIGESVLINDGAFKGFTGVLEELPHKLQQQINTGVLSELDDSMCATVGVNLFGRVTPATIAMRSLEKFS